MAIRTLNRKKDVQGKYKMLRENIWRRLERRKLRIREVNRENKLFSG